MTTVESNEMATLPPSASSGAPLDQATTAPPQTAIADPSTTTPASELHPAASSTTQPMEEDITEAPRTQAGPSSLQRLQSEAIGAATEDDGATASATTPPPEDAGPSIQITLLLTTGKRHPYKLDGKYLRKRKVNVNNDDPYELDVRQLKELIQKDWRDDWEECPKDPASIRLIMMGLELHEGELLKEKKFNPTGPNIVHMVIKRELPEDEEPIKDGKKKASTEEGGRRSTNCCGCVIL